MDARGKEVSSEGVTVGWWTDSQQTEDKKEGNELYVEFLHSLWFLFLFFLSLHQFLLHANKALPHQNSRGVEPDLNCTIERLLWLPARSKGRTENMKPFLMGSCSGATESSCTLCSVHGPWVAPTFTHPTQLFGLCVPAVISYLSPTKKLHINN